MSSSKLERLNLADCACALHAAAAPMQQPQLHHQQPHHQQPQQHQQPAEAEEEDLVLEELSTGCVGARARRRTQDQGHFASEEDAARAYDCAAVQARGTRGAKPSCSEAKHAVADTETPPALTTDCVGIGDVTPL
jgi:hypothetical protein